MKNKSLQSIFQEYKGICTKETYKKLFEEDIINLND